MTQVRNQPDVETEQKFAELLRSDLLQARQAMQGLLLVLATLLFVASPIASAVTWSGTTSTDWFDPTNWSGGTVPGPGGMRFLASNGLTLLTIDR